MPNIILESWYFGGMITLSLKIKAVQKANNVNKGER